MVDPKWRNDSGIRDIQRLQEEMFLGPQIKPPSQVERSQVFGLERRRQGRRPLRLGRRGWCKHTPSNGQSD